MAGIKSIKKQICKGQPIKQSDIVDIGNKKCQEIRGLPHDDSDSEEEDHIWKPVSLDLKDRTKVIDSLVDDVFEWNKNSKDGKESHKNFNEWLLKISDDIFSHHKKNADEDIFN